VESGGNDVITIEQLEVWAQVGVMESERAVPQRLSLTISMWPRKNFGSLNDEILQTVNYSAIAASARDFTHNHSTKLIETLAAQLASHLLQSFPVRKICIELRKFVLPDAKYVSVMLTRTA